MTSTVNLSIVKTRAELQSGYEAGQQRLAKLQEIKKHLEEVERNIKDKYKAARAEYLQEQQRLGPQQGAAAVPAQETYLIDEEQAELLRLTSAQGYNNAEIMTTTTGLEEIAQRLKKAVEGVDLLIGYGVGQELVAGAYSTFPDKVKTPGEGSQSLQ